MRVLWKAETLGILLICAAASAAGGDIKGSVSLDGKPTEGAVVRVLGANPKTAFITFTDTKGGYTFDRIPEGEYRLEVEKDGHLLRQTPISVNTTNAFSNLDVDRFESPTAITWHIKPRLLVLDLGRNHYPRVLMLRENGADLVMDAVLNIEPGFKPITMDAATWNGQEFIFLVLETPSGPPVIEQRNGRTGHLIRSWPLIHGGGGLAVDPVNGRVYVGSIQEKVVYELNLRTQVVREVADVSQVGVLGPVTIDAQRQRLYVADFKNGDVYLVELATKSHRKVASGLGNPISLALDDSGQMLYVVDGMHHRLWSLKTADGSRAMVVDATGFRSLADVSSIDGTLWLTDPDARAISHLTSDGAALKRYDYFISRQ